MGLFDFFSSISQANKALNYAEEQRNELEKSAYQKWKDYLKKNDELGIKLTGSDLVKELKGWVKEYYGGRSIDPTLDDVISEASIERYTKITSIISSLVFNFEYDVLRSEKYKDIFLADAKEIFENHKNNLSEVLYSKKIAGAMNKYISDKLAVSSQIPEKFFCPNVVGYKYDRNASDKYAKADFGYKADIEVEKTQELLSAIYDVLQSSPQAVK